ncbi:MAG TPA: thrombospondin type 3 repeat-containing protein [Polyangiaceae bacterium]|jgi:OOP family OmpA-OmpF porin|nr:thrombospondin type 3 repeat-containing protein [Polyangiaceae bacterium]
MARGHGAAVVAAMALAELSGLSASANAQTLPSINMSTWRPSPDPDASLVLEPAVTPGPWRWNFAAWTQYSQDPVVFRNRGGQELRAIAHFIGLDVTGNVGLGDRVSIGFDVPVVFWQNGDAPLPVNLVTDGTIASTALGDAAILGKVALLSNDRQGVRSGFGLSALGSVSLPTGGRSSFLSDGAVGGSLRLLAEYAVGIGAARVELGYAARWSHRMWPVETADGSTYGNTIPWAVGAVIRPKVFATALDSGDRQLWEVAVHGWLPGGPVAPFQVGAGPLTPLLVAVDDRIALGHNRDTSLLVGGELGLDKAVGVPTVRAVIAVQWAPRSHDRDGDGVADDSDQCPDLPEDRDGIQDADGCPEDDADSDGVLDPDDACPLVAGGASTDPKKNGCPEAGPAQPPAVPPEEKAPAPAPAVPPEEKAP